MEEGMTFTIEPILTTGDGRTTILKDGWSVSTIDGKPCAQFEDTVLITESGCDNLTEDLNSIDYE
ncbi:Methionine aminopeptidase 1D, mitochondrial [Bonamia ostreae]|uniref:Methionine aminopeptidase 1D, mitochondrial n=1 Tax=Bonamia ostreae TaxID=126728 RepID=A0ABV2AUR4_9EUKA